MNLYPTGSSPVLRLPFFKKVDDVFRADTSGGFEFPLLLAYNEFAVRIKNGQAGDPFFKGNFIFFCAVPVLVVTSHVHMNHVVVLVDEGCDLPGMKRGVQDVAVVTPIAAKHQNDSLGVFGSYG